MFRFNERIKAEKAFQNIFGTKLHPFIDIMLTKLCNQIIIDIIKFDDYLEEKHSDYIDGISMEDIILKHYGQKGSDLITELLPKE